MSRDAFSNFSTALSAGDDEPGRDAALRRLYEEAQQARMRAEQAHDRAASLQRITAALTGLVRPGEIAAATVSSCAALLGAYAGGISLLTPDGAHLEIVGSVGYSPATLAAFQRFPLAAPSPIGDAVRDGRPVLIETPDAIAERYPAMRGSPSLAVAALPLSLGERVVGGLGLSFDQPRSFDAEDRAFLTTVAQQCAQALERARLYELAVEARHAAERAAARSARLQAVTAALGEAMTVAQVAQVIAAEAVQALGAATGALVLLHEHGTELDLAGVVGFPPEAMVRWRSLSPDTAIPALDAIRRQMSIWLPTHEAMLAAYPHLRADWDPAHVQAIAAIPVLAHSRAIGVLALAFASPLADSPEDRALALALAQQCAQAIERAKLYEAEHRARAIAEETQRQSAFLAEASRLLADSLDYDERLARLTRLVVPFLADYSLLYAVAPDGAYVQVAVAHVDPAKEPFLRELGETYRVDMANPTSVIARVLRSGEPILVAEANFSQARAITAEPRLLELYVLLSPASYMVIPLSVAGVIVGTLFLATADSGRRYGAGHLALAIEVARRAAIALDNARLFREAQAAIQVRDSFFSVAAHELKTPLTALLGQAQLLRRRAARDDELGGRYLRSAELIAAQAGRLNAMINELLDVARIERGQFALDLAPLDLRILVCQVVEEIAPLSEQHTITCATPDTPLLVRGDAARLEQVVQNLLQNALKYSPAGGAVAVSLQGDGDAVRLLVRDEGIGIPAAALSQLFQRFFRARNAEAQRIDGMGVGLYVVREIVTLHGGAVAVESVEGAGSTFVVTLPALAPARAPDAGP